MTHVKVRRRSSIYVNPTTVTLCVHGKKERKKQRKRRQTKQGDDRGKRAGQGRRRVNRSNETESAPQASIASFVGSLDRLLCLLIYIYIYTYISRVRCDMTHVKVRRRSTVYVNPTAFAILCVHEKNERNRETEKETSNQTRRG